MATFSTTAQTAFRMGIAQVNPNEIQVKREFRYLFEVADTLIYGSGAKTHQTWAVQATRPSAQFDEIEIRHTQETVSYPSRLKWEQMQVTFIDLNRSNEIYDWIYRNFAFREGRMSYFDEPHGFTPGSRSSSSGNQQPKRNCIITMFNGMGQPLEIWTIEGAWPAQVNWGDLDVQSNDYAKVQATFRFDRAYISYFGDNAPGGETVPKSS